MLSRTKKILLFILTAWRLHIWKRKSSSSNPAGNSSNAFRLYRDCSELPLSPNFEDCICDSNLQSLIISGNPTEDELQQKWFDIYCEFIDLSDSTDAKLVKRIILQINVLTARLARIQTCVNTIVLLSGYWPLAKINAEAMQTYKTCIDSLRSLGFRYAYDPEKKSFQKDIELTRSRSIEWEIQLELRDAEYQSYLQKNKGEPISRVYFTQAVVRMSAYYKYRIDKRSLTVAEFFAMKKDYVDYLTKAENENNGKRQRR